MKLAVELCLRFIMPRTTANEKHQSHKAPTNRNTDKAIIACFAAHNSTLGFEKCVLSSSFFFEVDFFHKTFHELHKHFSLQTNQTTFIEQMRVKIVLVALLVSSFEASAELKRKSESSVTVEKGPLFYVRELIEDWNRKHSQIGDVVLFNIGNESVQRENIAKAIPKENPLVIVDPENCNRMGVRKAAFIIITTETLNAVSFRQKVKQQSSNF
jgi:hypothetical protein